MMKYNALSTSSLNSDVRKSTLTIYTDVDINHEKVSMNEEEITSIRNELEIVQRALKLQTRRCRQLVTEYTKRLQEKEQLYQSEKQLRDNQLAKVLRALLIFEARLRQEQKYISHQLKEKDYIIKKQKHDICKLLSNQYCKHCRQSCSPTSNMESLDSSLDYQDYQSSNFESLDSSSETYATISERDYNPKKSGIDYSYSGDEHSKHESESTGSIFLKNKNSYGRRGRKLAYRKSVGTYFEVLKLRNDSSMSNEDNTSNDYERLDSLPSESITDKISVVSERIENIFTNTISNSEHKDTLNKHPNKSENANDSSSNISESDCNNTVIQNNITMTEEQESEILDNIRNNVNDNENVDSQLDPENKISKISESIPVFEDDEEKNYNWYASASDQEDEEQRDMYRNNPVLECMNQILLQNINDSMNSPPKTPNVERKSVKIKRVKFSDEEDNKQQCEEIAETSQNTIQHPQNTIQQAQNSHNTLQNPQNSLQASQNPLQNIQNSHQNVQNSLQNISDNNSQGNYYETPIQKIPNFYETPQSIYSNDYEQILSSKGSVNNYPTNIKQSPKKNENLHEKSSMKMIPKHLTTAKNTEFDDSKDHYYVDMDTKSEEDRALKIVRKNKILRTPPALPPKPANLVSKYKLQNLPQKTKDTSDVASIESEPDYCSISELNLPTNKSPIMKQINVVAEINAPHLNDSSAASETQVILHKPKVTADNSQYDWMEVNNCIPKLVVSKNIEKFNIQIAKQTTTKPEINVPPVPSSPKKKQEPEIPKLPQVTEIIIPEETDNKIEQERINQDNYVKNNTQVMKSQSSHRNDQMRRPIIGTSVSSLITGFNNQKLISEIHQKYEKPKISEKRFTSFENLQNLDKQSPKKSDPHNESLNFETFDLSQNFEEFKLDDCEIGEEYKLDLPDLITVDAKEKARQEITNIEEDPVSPTKVKMNNNNTKVENVRATNDITVPVLNANSIQQLKKQLELQKSKDAFKEQLMKDRKTVNLNEPTYEHFLECTGLSSKSILTPSRLLSNHKSVLKPKDVKLRSKVKSNNVFERQGSTIKYWSEPYI